MFINSIVKWFAGSGQKPVVRRARTSRLHLESLENREVPAVFGGLPHVAVAQPAIHRAAGNVQVVNASNSLGDSMANFLKGRVNTRVGGGECAHIATEALRVAGADFTRTEPNGTTDYVWTSNRIARLTNGSQLAGKKFQVGDIIQYQNATLSSGGPKKLAHHTQVVAAVDSSGRITKVYEQNFNNNRTVQVRTIDDLSKLTGGSVSIYRAVARKAQAGLVEFTIVNNTNASRTYTVKIGTWTSNGTLDKANTLGSYSTPWYTFSGNPTRTISIGKSSVALQDGAGYELYTMSNGQVGIRRM